MSVHIGQTAPGLGTVIDYYRMQEGYSPTVRYSGKKGQMVLIVLTKRFAPSTFGVAPWYDGDDEPENVIMGSESLDGIYKPWNDLKQLMKA